MTEHAQAPDTSLPSAPLILVADDQQAMRQVLNLGLLRHGFAVLLAADGAEALALYREHQADIAVVLLDMNMPGLKGPEVLAGLRQLNPRVCCCLIGGDLAAGARDALGAGRYFQKPFRLEDVAEILWQLVRGRAN